MDILFNPWLWLFVLAMIWIVRSLIIQNRDDKLFPYNVRINKWMKGIVGDPAWPEQRLGWFIINEYRCSEAKLPKIGDEISGLPIADIKTTRVGNIYVVDVCLGIAGESNLDVYNARRKVLIEKLANGEIVSKEDRISYDLM
jgi:hypothetical protein